MKQNQVFLVAGGLLATLSMQALTLEVQRFAAGQDLPAGYQNVADGIDVEASLNVSAEPFVDYLIPNNTGSVGITAQKFGGAYITSSTVGNLSGGANNGINPDQWQVVFNWEDGDPLPFGTDFYGVSWGGWSNTAVEELSTRIDLASAEEVTVYHWFNDGWNYANGGHSTLSGHVITVTQYNAGGAELSTQSLTLPSGGAETYFGDHRQFYSGIITATRNAEGDYLIITNRGGNLGYKGTAVALLGGSGGGGNTIQVNGIGTLNFVPADPGTTAPVTGNTKLRNNDGSLSDAAWSGTPDTNPASTDPLWRDRTTWGGLAPEMPHFFTGGNGNLAIMPSLNTTTAVTPDTYDVYVVFTADRRPLQPEWTTEIGDAGGSVAAALSGQSLGLHTSATGTYTGLFGAEVNTSLGYDFNLLGVFVSYVGTVFNADSVSVDIAPFVGAPPSGSYRPSYHGIAYIAVDKAPGPGVFSGYVAENGWVNTGAWIGWVYTDAYPWVFSHTLQRWIYASGDDWFNIGR